MDKICTCPMCNHKHLFPLSKAEITCSKNPIRLVRREAGEPELPGKFIVTIRKEFGSGEEIVYRLDSLTVTKSRSLQANPYPPGRAAGTLKIEEW